MVAEDAVIEVLCGIEEQAEIVGGQLVLLPAHGPDAGLAIVEILMHLATQHNGNGHALGSDVNYLVDLPGRSSFCPDVSYFAGVFRDELIHGAPLFAVEVRGEGEQGVAADMAAAAKRRDYFAAGTRVVWDVDVSAAEIIRAYHYNRPDAPLGYRRGDRASAGPVLPGWELPVDEILAEWMAA